MKTFGDVNPDAVYSTADVAKVLGMSVQTVHRWAKLGLIDLKPMRGMKRPLMCSGRELQRFIADLTK